MSVVIGKINKHETKRIKMENKRYNFGGFTFGDNGLSVLRIETINHTNSGTNYTTEINLELNPDERLELLEQIIKLNEKDVR